MAYARQDEKGCIVKGWVKDTVSLESDRICHGAGGGGGTSNNSREADGDRIRMAFFKVGPLAVGKLYLLFSRGLSGGSVEFRLRQDGRDECGNIVRGGVRGEIAGGGCGC